MTGFFGAATAVLSQQAPAGGGTPSGDAILLETGVDYVLLESGDFLLREFDPPPNITWHSLFWTETDSMDVYDDGDTVTTWFNETGESDAGADGTPTMDRYFASLNSQPAITFDGTGDSGFDTDAFTANPSTTNGISIVVVADTTGFASGDFLTDGTDSSNRHAIYQSTSKWAMYAGSVLKDDAAATVGPQLHVAFFDGASSTHELNGTESFSGNTGSQGLAGLAIAQDTNHANEAAITVALVGVYEGDVKTDGSWSDFETWVTRHYGITIA